MKSLKKVLIVFLSLMLICSLCACDNAKDEDNKAADDMQIFKTDFYDSVNKIEVRLILTDKYREITDKDKIKEFGEFMSSASLTPYDYKNDRMGGLCGTEFITDTGSIRISSFNDMVSVDNKWYKINKNIPKKLRELLGISQDPPVTK